MKTSNIILGLLAGAAIGGIVAIVLKAENAIIDGQQDDEDEFETPRFKNIAKQFSDKISSDLKTAETKLKTVVQRGTQSKMPDEESGIFL